MSAILSWSVEEGTLSKGGTGSGINLSAIGSSLEPLRGGGTASGPVSFMRGADASAGTIKCLHQDTDLVTDHGVVPIRAVAAGWRGLAPPGVPTLPPRPHNREPPPGRGGTPLGGAILFPPPHP